MGNNGQPIEADLQLAGDASVLFDWRLGGFILCIHQIEPLGPAITPRSSPQSRSAPSRLRDGA